MPHRFRRCGRGRQEAPPDAVADWQTSPWMQFSVHVGGTLACLLLTGVTHRARRTDVLTVGQERDKLSCRLIVIRAGYCVAGIGMKADIPRDWKPTSANINALPDPLRRYIHDLESRVDSGRAVRTIAMLSVQVEELQALLAHERRQNRHRPASTPSPCQRRFSP